MYYAALFLLLLLLDKSNHSEVQFNNKKTYAASLSILSSNTREEKIDNWMYYFPKESFDCI